MSHNPSEKLSTSMDRNIKKLNSAQILLRSYLENSGICQDDISAVELAAYEALVNVIEYGSDKYSGDPVQISCCVTNKKIRTELRYLGKKFDITKVKLPDIVSHYKAGKRRGLGIYFIRTLMDGVDYSYEKGTNTLVLTKNLE
jgi:serine/threonine-protein kinase RsbW